MNLSIKKAEQLIFLLHKLPLTDNLHSNDIHLRIAKKRTAFRAKRSVRAKEKSINSGH